MPPLVCGLWTVVCGLLFCTTGCVRRSLTIRTEPAGAMVYVNDQLKGNSPVAYDFEWYGWHRVMVRKEGYERLDDRKLLRAPVYLWIPLDLMMELLPFSIRDTRTWSYTLTRIQEPLAPQPPFLSPVPPPAQEAVAPPTEETATEDADAPR